MLVWFPHTPQHKINYTGKNGIANLDVTLQLYPVLTVSSSKQIDFVYTTTGGKPLTGTAVLMELIPTTIEWFVNRW
jgi:hypothetical protein